VKRLFAISVVLLFSHLSLAGPASGFGKLSLLADEVEDPLLPYINWYTFEDAIDANKEEKKFIFIDLYTDWCGWCKKMDQTTFSDTSVATYMNEHFYAVKMNAESKEGIAYKEVLYEYKTYGNKGYNELAYSWLGGQMSFPSFVILSKKEVKLGTIVGFKQPFELITALKAYVEK
jgi:thioredoxin-related protein